ncbi:MAG: D-glycero-beta-D-manno-heptose 1-phosphate adenylyltransferase [Candidatus Nanoarchaeia archaeon]|nr:D-glycero-beta-D-manno-heptose 1-phosphate adenylyltransferase [Candidatus Nanoarchaeia archaeon]MDD5741150.1 D-glycero-beta-D-manno-heptose 1-phosphate adenylyltransferase [Candidatus Nanoarchaeia archaeon]
MDIKEILNNFSKAKIAVIGDIMLDNFIYGIVDRVSPEAPVIIVKETGSDCKLGGAANVAANISSLNGKVSLFGYTGDDEYRKILMKQFEDKNIDSFLLPVLEKTTKKTRIIGIIGEDKRQQIVRIDQECYAGVTEEVEEKLAKAVCNRNPDIIIASDYAKGGLTNSLFSKIREYSNKTRIIIDPKPKNKENYYGAYLITPNTKEAREMSQLDSNNVEEIGRYLQNRFRSNILITRGKEGMSLFEGGKIIDLPTQAREVYDVTGAGDTVIAVMGLGLASGLNLEESADLANHAAGIVVGRAGTATVSASELEQTIESENKKIKSLEDLKIIREDYHKKGKKVVWTNGCFDLIHIGHIDYLKKARKLGDCLFVGLNSDNSIKKLKGEGRPINNEKHRAETLSSLEFVDYTTIFPELTSENCLRELKPDFFVKAGDYNFESMNQKERKIVENYGGKIVFIPIIYDTSTTDIINKIKNGR